VKQINPQIKVLIDTNLLIRASMQKNERVPLQSVIEYSKEGKVQLIVSEIIYDEMIKYETNFDKTLGVKITELGNEIRCVLKTITVPSDYFDFKEFMETEMIKSLYQYKGNKEDEYSKFLLEFKDFFKTEYVSVEKPNMTRYYETDRKITRGEMKKINSNDIHLLDFIEEICESVLEGKVCFVTENKGDFFEHDLSGNYLMEDNRYKVKGLTFPFLYGFSSILTAQRYIKRFIGGAV